jgi:hypothetical protein
MASARQVIPIAVPAQPSKIIPITRKYTKPKPKRRAQREYQRIGRRFDALVVMRKSGAGVNRLIQMVDRNLYRLETSLRIV